MTSLFVLGLVLVFFMYFVSIFSWLSCVAVTNVINFLKSLISRNGILYVMCVIKLQCVSKKRTTASNVAYLYQFTTFINYFWYG